MTDAKIIGSKPVKRIVNIDGNEWQIFELGVGSRSRLSQHFHRVKMYSKHIDLIDKKIENDTVTSEELNQYEVYLDKVVENESATVDILSTVFNDGTELNKSVKDWFYSTPEWKMQLAINEALNASDEIDNGEKTEPTA